MGIKAAQGDLLVFTDDDLLLDKDFILAHRAMHRLNSNSLVHGCIYNLPYLKFFEDPATGSMVDGFKKRETLTAFCSINKSSVANRFASDIHSSL